MPCSKMSFTEGEMPKGLNYLPSERRPPICPRRDDFSPSQSGSSESPAGQWAFPIQVCNSQPIPSLSCPRLPFCSKNLNRSLDLSASLEQEAFLPTATSQRPGWYPLVRWGGWGGWVLPRAPPSLSLSVDELDLLD